MLEQDIELEAERNLKIYNQFLFEQKKISAALMGLYLRSLLTLSSAFLAISIVFTQNIVRIESAIYIPCLIIAWIFFIITIVSVLVSMMALLHLNSHVKDNFESHVFKGTERTNKHIEKIEDLVGNITLTPILFFIVGIVLFTFFISINVYQLSPIPKDTQSRQEERTVPSPMLF